MFVVIRRPHTNISKAADLLRFSRSAISNFFIKITEEEIKKKKIAVGGNTVFENPLLINVKGGEWSITWQI